MQEYEKLQMIGKGSFATIWKVRHEKLGYIRAVKVSNELVDDENDPAYRSFLNECKVLLKIGNGSHPNIVHIYQPRLIDNRAVVEMDYVEGETMEKYLSRVKFVTIDEFYRFFDEIVGALAYCHHDIYRFLMDPNVDDLVTDPNDGQKYLIDEATERRLVEKYSVTHNDIHSNNVMRRSYDGNFILLDFGLSIQDGKAVKSSSRRGGALEYMSPEKFDDSGVITTQSDIYSLGVLLYEVLAGRVPFQMDPTRYSSNPTAAGYEIMTAHKEALPPPIEPLRREAFEKVHPGETYVKDYPDWLEDMILKCLEKNPANRYADAKVLLDEYKAKKALGNDVASSRTFPIGAAAMNSEYAIDNNNTSTPSSLPINDTLATSSPTVSSAAQIPQYEEPTAPQTIRPGVRTNPPVTQYSQGATPPAKKKKSHAGLIVFLILLFLAILGVGAYFGYQWYEDSQYAHYYTYASSLNLRSSQSAKSKSNIIEALPYGTKLYMVSYGNDWCEVKANTSNGKQTGYVSTDYILSESDYYLMDGIFGNSEAREMISEQRCRKALLEYFKDNKYRGYLSDDAYKAIGQQAYSDSRQMWQVSCYSPKSSYNSVYYCREYEKNSKYRDMVVIISRMQNNVVKERKLVYFYFDSEGKSYVVYEEVPDSDRIKSVSVNTSWWTGSKTFDIEYY